VIKPLAGSREVDAWRCGFDIVLRENISVSGRIVCTEPKEAKEVRECPSAILPFPLAESRITHGRLNFPA
jgi:hypothetical protein